MTGKLIIVLALFAFCQGEECSPANQCKDLWRAKECGVVTECIADVWSKAKPTGYSDDVCSICLRMVKEARDTLRSNETRSEINEVLEGSCKLLVLKPAVECCDKVVDQLGEELVEVLSSQMDPETVCAVAKLCNNVELRNAQKNSKECVHCEAFAYVAQTDMNSVSLDDFKNGILGVCRSAGGFSDVCSHLGIRHASFLYNTVTTVLKRKPCEATLVCPSNPNQVTPNDTSEAKKQMCPLCKIVMKDLRKQLLRVKNAEEFAENMKRICGLWDISNKTCSHISSESFYKKLQSFEALPDLFCHVTYCMEKPKEKVPVWPLVPAQSESSVDMDLFDLMAFAELLEVKTEKPEVRPRPTIAYGDPIENPVFLSPVVSTKLLGGEEGDCKTCDEVLDILSKPLRYDDDYVNKMFEVICDGVEDAAKCKKFIESFGPYLKKALVGGNISKEMCGELMPYCKDSPSEKKKAEGCGLCLSFMKVLRQGDSATLGERLEDKCKNLQGVPSNSCRDMSSTFLSLVGLLKNSNETEACKFVNFCDSTSAALKNAESNVKTSCNTCLITVQSITDALKSDMGDDVIKSILDSLCDLLPHSEKHLCYNLVKNIGIEGFKRLMEEITPSDVCHYLHLCSKSNTERIEEGTALDAKPSDKVPCKFCQMAIKMLLDQLGDSKTEDSIRKALENLCNYFPEETKDTCRNLIDQYTDTLIDMILADFNSTEICIYLKLCPTSLFLEAGKVKNVVVYDVETNEVRDWIEEETGSRREEYTMRRTEVVEKSNEEAFQRFHEVVQECAMCEALVGVISRHKSMMKKDYDFQANAHRICAIVPRDKFKKCSSMLVSYGPSIVNLLMDHNVEPDEICVYIDLCSSNMQAKVNSPVSVPEPKVVTKPNDCMRGPVFWCANAENAEKCGTFLHCQETVWKTWKNPPKRPSKDL